MNPSANPARALPARLPTRARRTTATPRRPLLGCIAALWVALVPLSSAHAQGHAVTSALAIAPSADLAGQSVTQLPDGRWLLAGGRTATGPVTDLKIRGADLNEDLPVHLLQARSGHTATVLPNGLVWVVGGVGRDGRVLADSELIDPVDGTVQALPTPGLTARTEHTALVLTNGEVLLAGGRDAEGLVLATAQRWNPRTQIALTVNSPLEVARYAHSAALLSSGEGWLSGGQNAGGQPVTRGELYDPRTALVSGGIASSDARLLASQVETTHPAAIMESVPAQNAVDVALDTVIGIRFNHRVPIERLSAAVITLVGPNGAVTGQVSGAERGMLAFFVPAQELRPATTYTLFITGLIDDQGQVVPRTSVRFTTHRIIASAVSSPIPSLRIDVTPERTPAIPATTRAPARPATPTSAQVPKVEPAPPVSEAEDWIPTQANRFGRWHVIGLPGDPPTHVQDTVVTPLTAAPGTTALTGRVVRVNGLPLAGVAVSVDKATARTDADGQFILTGVPAGTVSVHVDGTGVAREGRHYTQHFIAATTRPGETTALPALVYLSRVDPATEVAISSPASHDVVLTHPAIPGLEVRIPKGAVIRDQSGRVVTKVSITPVPMDRAPYPSPVPFSTYFTLQPGGAYVDGDPSQAIEVTYPNNEGLPAGTRVDFWNYDVTRGWRVYGHGTVTADAKQIRPDPDTRLREVMTFGIGVGGAYVPPGTGPTPGKPCSAGDPVDCPTGIFLHTATDLVVRDVIPISVSRIYRTNDNQTHGFGVGTNLSYGLWLSQAAANQQEIDLIQADGSRIAFYQNPTVPTQWQHATTPTGYYGATLTLVNNAYWLMQLTDGTTLRFLTENPVVSPLTSIIDRHGNTVTLTYAASTNPTAIAPLLTQITSPTGRYIKLYYDANARINQAVDDAGRSTSYTYDTQDHLISATDADGYTEGYGYDPVSNNLNLVTDKRGNAMVKNLFDANGRVSQQTLADGAVWKFSYTLNPNGTVAQTTVTDPRNYVRQVTMNAAGYPTAVISALGQPEQQTTTILRDPGNRPYSVTDALGRTTVTEYDPAGDVTGVTLLADTANQVSYLFSYDPVYHQLTSVTDPLAHTTLVQRDTVGNAIAITDPLGHTTNVQYNGLGLPTQITDALGHQTGLAYVGADLASITDALGRTSRVSTDEVGRTQATVDPLGNATQLNRDAMDRVQTVIDPLGQTTTLSYDQNGNLLTVKDPRNVVQTYTYDSRNRRHTYLDPAGKTETDNYDGLSNLTSVIDRKGQTTSIQYDGINRPTLITFNDRSTITITWDAGNRTTKYVDSINGTISRTYDLLDRLTQEVTPQGTVNHQYDTASRRANLTVTGQTEVFYTFDAANRLTGITQGANAVVIGYDAANRLSTVTWPNGVVGTYTLDNANQLTGLSFAKGSTVIGSLGYGYDLAGRRTSLTGTLAAFAPPTESPSIAYDGTNRLTSRLGLTTTYDANGNLTALGSTTYTWNARNQLTATSAGSSTFAYDALGRRVSAVVAGSTTGYQYDGLNPVMLGGNFMLAGLGLDENYARVTSGTATSLLTDGLGSTVVMSSSTAATTASYVYSPYGDTVKTGTDATPLEYTGRENDGATGLYYNRARYYSPALGRFISDDPSQFQGGANFYAYAGGSPTNFTDPRGLAWDLPSLPQGIADSVTGFGDGINLLGFSPSQYIRAGWGISDPCASPAYLTGKDVGEWYTIISPFAGRLGYVARVSKIPSIVETVEEAYAERAALKAEYRSVLAPIIAALERDPTLGDILLKAAVKGDEYAIARAGTTSQFWNIVVGAATGYAAGSRALGGN